MDPRLYEAATEGNQSVLREIAQNEPNLLTRLSSPNMNTILHIAANFDNRSFVEEICYRCSDLIEKQNTNGDTPLHIAARAGHPLVVEFLIFWARYFIASSSRETGDHNDANVLLRLQNIYGDTPLHEAVRSSNPKVADVVRIIEAFLLVDPQSMSAVNMHDESPFYLAAHRGLVDSVKNMLELIREQKMLELIREDTSQSIYGGPNRQTAMHAAVARKRTDILQILVQKKKELIEVANDDKRTPLHYAASFGYLKGVELLLENDVSGAYQKEDKDGLLPIHMAAIKGHNDIVECMLKGFPDLRELLNQEDQNVLHVAAKSGKQKVVKSIIKMPKLSMLINQKDNNGNTPLHLATTHRHPKIVSTLVRDKRVDTSVINDKGLTALDIAEKDIDELASFRKHLTLTALRTVNAPRGQHQTVIEENSELEKSKLKKSDSIIDFYRDRINTLVLVAALITTVTFAAGFTMPGGFNNDGPRQGMATMLTKFEFQFFLICNIIAMYSSIIATITLIWAQLGDAELLVSGLKMSLVLLTIALTMMALAFGAGVYLVVSKLKWLAYLVLVTSFVFLLCILAPLVALQVPLWSKYPVLRGISHCVFRVLVHVIEHK